MDEQKRIVWIDYLRCIGLLLVISSHVFGTNTPALQLLFGCNVAIMIVVSGYCAVRSSACSTTEYYKRRGIQMIVHTWIFFVVYFILIFLLSYGEPYPYSKSQIMKTFLFLDGIGYTWIIAVFIITALFVPIIGALTEEYPIIQWAFPILYWSIGLALLVVQPDYSFAKVLSYVGGYVFLTFVGYSICSEKRWLDIYLFEGIAVLAFCIMVVMSQGGDVFDLAGNKYPPSVYYVTYGMTVSLALMRLLARCESQLRLWKVSKYITAVSKQSLDVYLWHILGLYLSTRVEGAWLRFLIVLVVAILVASVYRSMGRVVSHTIAKPGA